MTDPSGTNKELLEENAFLKQRIQELGHAESENKKVDEERKSHIRFLECLERVDRAIKQEIDVEQMLRHILETVFAIFNCDRTWLFYPCDPDAPTFRVPMEIYRPEYPGAKVFNEDVPMTPDLAQNLREILESSGPVTYIAGTERPINKVTAERFGVQSQMIVPLYPKLGKPWVFGMHQCSYPRIWTTEEKKLFEEIARRISDGLSSVLYLRELQESEERFRATFEQAAVGIAHISTNGRWLRVNRKLCDIVWYSREELLRKTFQDIMYHEDLDAVTESIRQVLAGEIPTFSTENRFTRKDGSQVRANLTVSIVRSTSGDPAYLIAVIEDIAERRQMEEKKRRVEDRMHALVHTIPDLIWLKDEDGVYLTCNRMFELFFGAKEADIVGKTDYDFVGRELADFFREKDRRAIAAGEPSRNEEWITFADDGRRALLDTIKTPMYDAEGTLIGVLGIGRDITELKQAEEERNVLHERLQRAEKMEALGVLAGGVAHDLNNVLGIIVGYSEMLLDGMDKSSPLRYGLEQVMSGGLKAAAIVDDLLTLARRGVPGRQVLNLNKLITDCQQSPEWANLSYHHPYIRIKTDLEPDLLSISGSSVHLGKTLYNLIANASEATVKDGVVTIKTANQYLDRPIHGYDRIREGDYVILSVSDTGEGIHAADLKRIFEPFYTKKVMGRSGTGLGLAVVWGTVKDHHGYINVQSEAGKGSTFTLYFPVTREEITAEHNAVLLSEYMGQGESILVVDDVKEQRDLAASMLRMLNYNVASVSSGEDAVAYVKEHEVDLMVLDMIMDPGMDGLDTYRSVLAIRPQQKAIIVSGFSESDRVHAARDIGAGAYVRKPYIKEKLGLAVRKELERR